MAFSTVRPKSRTLISSLGAVLALALAAPGQAQPAPQTPLAGTGAMPAARLANGHKRHVRNDFLGIGASQLPWRDPASGNVFLTPMNGTQALPGFLVYNETNPAWQIVGSGDFNGDGKSEMLWWNSDTGDLQMMQLTPAGVSWQGTVYTATSTAWQVQAVADFTGRGKASVLWRNSATGEIFMLPMDGSNQLPGTTFYQENRPQWKIVGAADFDGDGKADILWWNSQTGEVDLMLMDGANIRSQNIFYQEANTDWMIVGVGDFNGDGQADILWRNQATGQLDLMLMSGGKVLSQNFFVSEADPAWQIAAIGDFDGDGKDDLFWLNARTGETRISLMNGDGIATQVQGGALQGPTAGIAIPPVRPVIGKVFLKPNTLSEGESITYLACFTGGLGSLSPVGAPVFSLQPLTVDPYASLSAAASAGRPRMQNAGLPAESTYPTDYLLTVANAGGVSVSYRSSVVVPSFTLRTIPTTVAQGGTGAGFVLVNPVNGFADPVQFGVGGVPADWTCSFTNASSSEGTELLITVPPDQAPGNYTLDITGTDGPVTVHKSLVVTVSIATILTMTQPTPITYGQPISLSATLAPYTSPKGGTEGLPVSFMDFFQGASTPLGNGTLAMGQAALNLPLLPVGSHSLSATFNGTALFPGASSQYVTLVVNRATPTVQVSLSAAEVTQGSTVRITATVNGVGGAAVPTGPVTFFDGVNPLGAAMALVNGTAYVDNTTLGAGQHTISAAYGGDGNYTPQSGGNALLQVDAPPPSLLAPTLTVTSSNPAPANQGFNFQVQVSGTGPTPTGTVTIFIPGLMLPPTPAVLDASGFATFTNLPPFADPGNYYITINYSGDGSYSSVASQTFTQSIQ